MRDVFILDAVRTPRGRGKAGKGALSGVHPQELLAQALNRLAAARRPRARRRRGRRRRLRHPGQRAGREHRAQRRARGRLAGRGDRRDAEPLLRLGRAGGQLRGDGRHVAASRSSSSAAASRACRASRWAPTAAGIDGNNLHLREKLFQVPQGICADLIATLEGFSREDVDRFALASQHKAERAIDERPLREEPLPGRRPDGQGRSSTRTSTRAPARRSRRSPSSSPRSSRMGADAVGPNGETLDQIALAPLPGGEGDPARAHRRQLERHRRRRGRRAARVGRLREGARPQAARAHPRDGDRRRRAGHHAHRAGAGVREGARRRPA